MNNETALVASSDQAGSDNQMVSMWLYGKSPNTQKAYAPIIAAFRTFVGKPLQQTTLFDLQAFVSNISGSRDKQALTINALKSLFTFASDLNYLPVNIGKALKAPKARSELASRILTEEDVLCLINSETDSRNHAILRLLYHAGLRVSEIVGLKWGDIHKAKEGAILDVFGKGDEQRYVPISQAMHEELKSLDGANLGSDRYVFQGRKSKGGTLPMDTRHIERLVEDAAIRCDLETYHDGSGKKRSRVSPHWFRHANASHALDNGAAIHVVKDSLGHASLVTTTRYAHVKPGVGTSQYLKA